MFDAIGSLVTSAAQYVLELPNRFDEWAYHRIKRKQERREARREQHPRLRWLFDFQDFLSYGPPLATIPITVVLFAVLAVTLSFICSVVSKLR